MSYSNNARGTTIDWNAATPDERKRIVNEASTWHANRNAYERWHADQDLYRRQRTDEAFRGHRELREQIIISGIQGENPFVAKNPAERVAAAVTRTARPFYEEGRR